MLTHLLLVFFKSFSWLSFIFITKEFQGSLYFSLYCSIFKMLFPLPLRAALILYHIQNRLSSTFFKFFQKFFLCRSLLQDSFNIISLSFLFVKYFFQVFSKSFFVISSALFRGNLIIISLFLSFVKPFLKSFFSSSLSSSRNGLRLLFLFFFLFPKVKVIFSSLSPAVSRARQ